MLKNVSKKGNTCIAEGGGGGAGPFSVTCDWPFLKSVICEKAKFNSVICDRGIICDE